MKNIIKVLSQTTLQLKSSWLILSLTEIFILVLTLLISHIYSPFHSYKKYIIVVGILLMIMTLYVYLTKWLRDCSLEIVYIGMAVIMGLVFMLLIPVYCVPDEQVHYWKAYQLSNQILGVESDVNNIVMRVDDANLPITTEYKSAKSLNKYYRSINDPVNDVSLTSSGYTSWAIPDFLYLLPAIGISLARLLKLNTILLFFCGRFFNAMLFIGSTALSIRKIPIGKLVIFFIGLLPMTLQQTASYSYDAPITACGFLIVSYSLYILYDKQMYIGDWLILAVALSIIITAKSHAYFLLALIPLLGMIKLYKTNKRVSKIILVVIAVGFLFNLLVFLWDNVLFYYDRVTGWYPDGVEFYTIQYLLTHPSSILIVAEGTFRYKFDFYLTSLIGEELGYFNIKVPAIMTWLGAGILACASLRRKKDPIILNKNQRIVMFLISILSIMCVFGGMLLNWTPVGSVAIEGVQGRYFLPILPILLIAAQTVELEIDRKWDKHIICSESLWLVLFVFCIINRY